MTKTTITTDIEKLTLSKQSQSHSCEYDDDPIEDDERIPGIKFVNYRDESQLESVMRLVGKDLSEPYSGMSIYTFINLSFLFMIMSKLN
jgi:hypothetical protein